MPFPTVTKHNVRRNFDEVLDSIYKRLAPFVQYSTPDADGWTLSDNIAALQIMVATSSDKLWTAAIDSAGNSRAALLEARVDALELDQARLTEQLSSLAIGQKP